MPIFQDDPDAIAKLEEKLADLEVEKEQIKAIPKIKRDFTFSEEDMRSVNLTSVNARMRDTRNKITMIQNRADRGMKLTRDTVFVDNKKRFAFREEKAKGGFMGTVRDKTMFTVGEQNHKEFVSVKPNNELNFFSKGKSKGKSNNIFDVGF